MSEWTFPDRLDRSDGQPRQVGIEMEFQGIPIGDLAELVGETLGGAVERISEVEFTVEVPDQGEYRVEVDMRLLKEFARDTEEDESASGLRPFAVKLLSSASAMLVPCEIVSPPLPIEQMTAPMDALVDALRDAGAKGTQESVLYAFGVHLNVEPPDLEAETILAYLRAFVCLYPWILEAGDVDLSRRATPYIDPYDTEYEQLLMQPDYAPDWTRLIDDYLSYNPTRDRALDMLPMFAHQDEARVLASVDDPLIKPRPTFHYRLANCSIGQPGWHVSDPWRRWVRIESLANDPETLDRLTAPFLDNRATVRLTRNKRWAASLREMLPELEG